MKKNYGKWASSLVAVMTAFTLFLALGVGLFQTQAATEVAGGTCGDAVTWSLDSDGVLTIGGTGAMVDLASSSAVQDYVDYKSQITGVVVEDGVTSVGAYAFYGFSAITTVIMADSVETLGSSAFQACTGLTSITLSSELTSISSGCFNGCTALTGITLPDTLNFIGSGAFAGCGKLESIELPAGITTLDSALFPGCASLRKVVFKGDVTSIGNTCFASDTSLKSIIIPDTVTSISANAFSGTGLLSVVYEGDVVAGSASFQIGTPHILLVCYPEGAATTDLANIQTYHSPATANYTMNTDGTISLAVLTVPDETATTQIPCSVGYAKVSSVTGVEDYTILHGEYVNGYCVDCGEEHTPHVNGGDVYEVTCDVCGISFAAAVTPNNGETVYYVKLADALANLTSDAGNMVQLLGNAEVDASVSVSKPVELIMNGLSITGENGKIEFTGKTSITGNGTVACSMTMTSGTVVNGSFSDLTCGGAVDIQGGSFTALTTSGCTVADVLAEGYAYYDSTDTMVTTGLDGTSISNVIVKACTNHSYVDGKCAGCGAFEDGIGAELAGYTLSLSGNIGVNFYMELDESVVADATAYMQFTLPNGSAKIMVSDAVKDTTIIPGKTYYMFTCEVAAKEMTSEIKAQIITANGNSTEYSYTVKKYADYIIANNYSDETKALVKAMLNYGGHAQTYFEYNTDQMANVDLTEAEKSLENVAKDAVNDYVSSTEGTLPEGVTYYGSSVLMKSETTIRHYFTLAEGASISDYTFRVDGESVTPAVKDESYYYIDIKNVAAADLDIAYELTVASNVGVQTWTISYSAMSYVYAILDGGTSKEAMADLAKTLYLYWKAAEAYSASI